MTSEYPSLAHILCCVRMLSFFSECGALLIHREFNLKKKREREKKKILVGRDTHTLTQFRNIRGEHWDILEEELCGRSRGEERERKKIIVKMQQQ